MNIINKSKLNALLTEFEITINSAGSVCAGTHRITEFDLHRLEHDIIELINTPKNMLTIKKDHSIKIKNEINKLNAHELHCSNCRKEIIPTQNMYIDHDFYSLVCAKIYLTLHRKLLELQLNATNGKYCTSSYKILVINDRFLSMQDIDIMLELVAQIERQSDCVTHED